MNRYIVVFSTFLLLSGTGLANPKDPSVKGFEGEVKPFLNSYCISCHGPEKQKGDFRVDELKISETAADAEYWHLVLDNLSLGEMPPEKKKQPSQDELENVSGWIAAELKRAARMLKGDSGEVVFRRLNRTEYENTIEDLFGVRGDFAEGFTEDAKAENFDNNGAALMLSAAQMNAYMKATDYILDRAIQTRPRPKTNKSVFTLHDYNKASAESFRRGVEQKMKDLDSLTEVEQKRTKQDFELLKQNAFAGIGFPVYENGKLRAPTAEDGPEVDAVIAIKAGYAAPDTRHRFRARVAGWYRFAITAYGAGLQEEEPVRLQVAYGSFRQGTIPQIADILHLDSTEPKTYEYKLYLQPNNMVKLTMLDGQGWAPREKLVDLPGPFVVIRSMEMEGPLFDQWPPKGHQLLLGEREVDDLTDKEMPLTLKKLAPHLFRRPVSETILQDYLLFYEDSRKEDLSVLDAFKLTVKAMMASPHFLYHVEVGEKPDAFVVANRLSYFLWRSSPDLELLNLAWHKQLLNAEVLQKQVERMLADSKSERFLKDFCGQWLGIDQVGEMQPDQNLYPEYDPQLEMAMVGETDAFLREMLQKDLQLTNLIASDWTMLNARLAKHYGIDGVSGNEFQRVSLRSKDSVRGGLLGQASILNVTSNGTTTSPIVRGVWVLDRLLGNPAPPPPPDVPAIEPDIRGASTIKEQLAKHREIEQCANCHKKIDPYGMALENFDVIGGWREKYRALEPTANPNRPKLVDGPTVDVADTLPRYGDYKAFQEFRNLLLKQEDLLYHNVAHQLTTFALGRSMNFSDEPQIKAIVEKTKTSKGGLKTLIHEVVTSELFQKP